MVRSKTPFWRAFGIALLCHIVTAFVTSFVYQGAANAFLVLLGALGLFGLLAWKFPRGAAALLLLFSCLAVLSEVLIGVGQHPWRFLLLPVDIVAVEFAARAFRLAADYVAAERKSN